MTSLCIWSVVNQYLDAYMLKYTLLFVEISRVTFCISLNHDTAHALKTIRGEMKLRIDVHYGRNLSVSFTSVNSIQHQLYIVH